MGTTLVELPVARGSTATEDLREVAARVERAWRAAGAETTRRDTRFVMEDETITIDLRPAEPRADSGEPGGPRDASHDCRRVALIGARGMSFHVTAPPGVDETFRATSASGVIELHGCGSVPDVVKLKSDSGRGALETVIAASGSGTPAVSSVLLERTGGVLPASPEPGPLPPLPAPLTRAGAAEARLVATGMTMAPALSWTSGDDGKGGGGVTLDAGCHHVELFAIEPRSRDTGRHAHLDLDGSMRREGGEVIAEDLSSAPDVRLETCVGTMTRVSVTFDGAPRGSAVVGIHAFHPFPAHMPESMPTEVRARFASALLARGVQPLGSDAVALARGGSGSTPVPIELEPGACYVAVAAMDHARGRGHGISIQVAVGSRVSRDEQGSKDGAALVAFCARDSAHASIDVTSRSNASGWGVAVFRVAGGAWGDGE